MGILRSENDVRATDDLYSLSQFPHNSYTSWVNCIVNGVRFRCKECDDKFTTQCSGVCTWGGDENDIIYYGILLEIMKLDFINERNVFVFCCKWYNTNPRGKSMIVHNNLTSIDITSEWYGDEPFILASQAQQVFYMKDSSRGKNWRIVEKVNHRNIFDIVEHEVGETVIDDVFQEDDSREMPDFRPTEEVVETYSLVREDINPETVPRDMVNTEELSLNDHEMVDIDQYYDDGRLFVDDEPILESEHENDNCSSNTENHDDDDDDDFE